MPRLQFWPQASNALLKCGDETHRAGDVFEVSEEDAAELLTFPGTEVREAPDEGTELTHAGLTKIGTSGIASYSSQGPSGAAATSDPKGD